MPLSCRAARLNNGRANRSPTTTRRALRSRQMQALNRQWLTSRSRRRVISPTLSEANLIGRSPRRPHVWTRARRRPLTLQRSQQRRRECQRPARKSRRTNRRPTVRRRCCMACQYPPRLPRRGERVAPFSQPRGHCVHVKFASSPPCSRLVCARVTSRRVRSYGCDRTALAVSTRPCEQAASDIMGRQQESETLTRMTIAYHATLAFAYPPSQIRGTTSGRAAIYQRPARIPWPSLPN